MNNARRLNFVAMCERTLNASNWTSYDNAYVINGNHVVCFESTAKTDKMKSLLRTVVDIFNRQDSISADRDNYGAVVFENGRDAGSASIIGIIEATPQELERQYSHIRDILKPMGLCEGFAKRLFLDNDASRKFTLSSTSSKKTSRSHVRKITASIGEMIKGVNFSGEASVSLDAISSAERSLGKTAEVDFGAVRSALLVNIFSKDAGVGGLHGIIAMESVLASYAEMGRTEALYYLDRELDDFDRKLDVVSGALINSLHNNIYIPIKRKEAKGAYADEHSKHASAAMNNLRLVAEGISKSQVDADTFIRLFRSEDIFKNILNEKFVSGAINYCMHGIILFECLKQTREKIICARSEIERRPPENESDMGIVSSSLRFMSIRTRNKSDEGVKRTQFSVKCCAAIRPGRIFLRNTWPR